MRDIVSQWLQRPWDIAFVAVLALCLLLAGGSVFTELGSGRSNLPPGGARNVDLPLVRGKISNGDLSDRKALYYKKIPR